MPKLKDQNEAKKFTIRKKVEVTKEEYIAHLKKEIAIWKSIEKDYDKKLEKYINKIKKEKDRANQIINNYEKELKELK